MYDWPREEAPILAAGKDYQPDAHVELSGTRAVNFKDCNACRNQLINPGPLIHVPPPTTSIII